MGKVTVKTSSHLAEFSESLKIFNLTEAKAIQGFDWEGISSRHLAIIGYGNLFMNITEEIKEIHIDWSKERDKPILSNKLLMK